jgi:NAD(P)H-hydrate repair Nnr-like enzyme with NAD(P)H-hydrate epimerase domain
MFKTKAGVLVPTLQTDQIAALRSKTEQVFGLSPLQVTEACAFSFAMVVRYALGLSAEGAKTACIVGDTLAGWICLATARHLINSGAQVELIYVGNLDAPSVQLETQLNILGGYNVSLTVWDSIAEKDSIETIIGTCHNSLHGLADLGKPADQFGKQINEMLNELSTPIYAVDFPLSVNTDTGESQGSPLYASATLTLGVPPAGLLTAEEYTGRLYVCDALIPRPLYHDFEIDCSKVFSEQPVQQLVFPEQA